MFLGQAEDNLAVLLNRYDPTPGPILVIGEGGAGKTNFLKVIASSAISTHSPKEIQFGVLSNQPSEWHGLSNDPHCVGIFPANRNHTSDFIHTLRTLIDKHKIIRSVLFFIDGLEILFSWIYGYNALQVSAKSLSDGPAHRIWPIAAPYSSRCKNIDAWPKFFHTQVFGYTQLGRSVLQLIDKAWFRPGNKIVKGVQFSMKEQEQLDQVPNSNFREITKSGLHLALSFAAGLDKPITCSNTDFDNCRYFYIQDLSKALLGFD